jgi:hypothetical protein
VQDLVFAPERHYTDPERTCCIYNEMHTGDWWWAVQVCTVTNAQQLPRLIGSDRNHSNLAILERL